MDHQCQSPVFTGRLVHKDLKMRKSYFLLFLTGIVLSATSVAQSTFYKQLTGFNTSLEVKSVASPDGGWVTGGTSDGIKLVKYDKCGNIEWSKHYSGGNIVDCVDIVANASGGFCITGYSGSDPAHPDVYLLKLDHSGNVVFCKEYQAATREDTYSLGEDSSGNLYINGNSVVSGSLDPGGNFIIKTDSLGTILWSNLYGWGGMWARAHVCSDGGVLRSGGHSDIYKVDAAGNVLWAKRGFYSTDESVELADGYVIPGYTGRKYLCKLDFNGNLMWVSSQYGSTSAVQQLAVSASGNPVVVGLSAATEYDKATGNYLHHTNYLSPSLGISNVHITDINRLSNNAFIMAGYQGGGVIFNQKVNAGLHAGCADSALVRVDTAAAPLLNIHDTAYAPSPKSFVTTSLSVTAVDFDPLEVNVCSHYEPIVFSVIPPDTICEGQATTLSVSAPAGQEVEWSWYTANCGADLVGTGTSVIVGPGATQTYFLNVKGCDTTACVPVVLYDLPRPVAAFTADYMVNCEGLKADLHNQSSNATQYTWNFSDGFSSNEADVSHALGLTGAFNVSLIATNANACSDTMTLSENYGSVMDLFHISVPNVFTPNNDGSNDTYSVISDAGLAGCFSMKIFDRWGLEIFSSEQKGMKWDGRTSAGEKVSPGTYFYLLKIADTAYKGEITLLE
ncbi:MAG: hypothetical protein JWO09_255 [Bacteroidetes bacterium]|nr:hypothetical protein [Bacteroidota bacterium]